MNTSPAVSVEDLSIEYRRGRRTHLAASGVTFSIQPGETVALVGESGSGKTSIGRAIQGLVEPAQGTICLAGTPMKEIRRHRARAIAAQVQTVFQDPFGSLNPARTIGSTLAEPLRVHRSSMSRAERSHRVGAELERVGLPASAAARYPVEFSGGQRQRIAIARALIAEPSVIICDEAVSALDLSIQAQILNLLAEIQRERGVSILFISHDLSVVQHVATRVLVLCSGSLVDSFDTGDFSSEERQPYTQRLFAAAPVPDPSRQRARRAAFEGLDRAAEGVTR